MIILRLFLVGISLSLIATVEAAQPADSNVQYGRCAGFFQAAAEGQAKVGNTKAATDAAYLKQLALIEAKKQNGPNASRTDYELREGYQQYNEITQNSRLSLIQVQGNQLGDWLNRRYRACIASI